MILNRRIIIILGLKFKGDILPYGMKNKLIFFVDDDKMMLNLMEYTFKCREGFEVKSYFSGEECIDNLKLES